MPTPSTVPNTRDQRGTTPEPVLFLDCPQGQRPEIERQVATANLRVVWADSSEAAVAELRRRDMPVLVSFSRVAAALQFIRDLRAQNPAVLLFAVVEPGRPDLATEAVLAGVADILPSPSTGQRIAAAIEREAAYAADRELPASVTGLHDLYSESPAMREVCALIARAPVVRAGVLIKGEAGTGRRRIARAIHAADKSRSGQFVSIDCAAFHAEQLEHELFGVAARASEDHLPAHGFERLSRSGRLHDAFAGTLYLQNIVEAPTRVQRRLARLLRDREATLVEESANVAFDVRCITGADQTIEVALHDGRVEEALYRRLSSVCIDAPPLRNRLEDIPALANYFMRQSCASLRVPYKLFSRSALALLSALPWRGNAAELRTLLHTIVSRLGTRGIGVEAVLAHVRLDAGSTMLIQGGTLRQARARFEHEYIAAILQQHRGRITHAAKALGMQRTNLYRKMRTLRVAQPRSR
jgi:DNA-binding NtrC family response regulator